MLFIDLGVPNYIVTTGCLHCVGISHTKLRVHIRVENGLAHPDHVLPGSSGSDPHYKTSGSDLNFVLDLVC